MLKQILAGTAAVAAMGLAAGAMAGELDAENYEVFVTIEVAPSVSMWANDEFVTLTMDGQDGNNSATSESSISHINNVAATISAEVDGTLPNPSVPGGGINFFIFDETDPAGAVAAITDNAYNPIGALVWNQSSLGTSQDLAQVPIANNIVNRQITYASASPGENPDVADYDLTVTWTIADATP